MKLDRPLIPYTRINSKLTEDIIVELETIKILKESIGGKISDISHSNIFSDISLQARKTREKNKQMGLCQTKMLAHQRNHQQMKGQPTKWENISISDIPDEGLISKIYIQLNTLFSR